MEPKKIKRLVLNKETISSLDSQEQNELRGGTVNTQKCASVKCEGTVGCTAESNRDCNPWSYDCSYDCYTDNCTDGWYC